VIKCFILYSSNGNRLFFHLKGLRSLVSDILNEHCGKTRNPNYAQNTYRCLMDLNKTTTDVID